MSEYVLVERHDHILRVQLNRPQKKNALLGEMYEALIEAFKQADSDDAIHVIYLTGSGDSFSAGNDLRSFIEDPESTAAARFIKTISITETPIVASVNGLAVGVGVTMLLHCDLVYAVSSAVFNFAFIDLGAVPEAASSYLMPRLVGQRRSAELLMLGDKFDAHTAHDIGLINAVLDADDLEKVAWEKAQRLASKPPIALRKTKMLLKRGTAQTVAETIDYELEVFAERIQSEEAQSIMQAFFNR